MILFVNFIYFNRLNIPDDSFALDYLHSGEADTRP